MMDKVSKSGPGTDRVTRKDAGIPFFTTCLRIFQCSGRPTQFLPSRSLSK